MRNRELHNRFWLGALAAFLLLGILAGAVPAQERALVLESIEVRGNKRATDEVVVRHAALSAGDEVTVDVLEAARARLLSTGYFSSVEVFTRRGSERGRVVAIIKVEEQSNPIFETGIGYHDVNGWFLTILGIRLNNWLGADSQTRIGFRVGFRLSGLDAEWRKPVSNDGRVGIGVKLHLYNLDHQFFGAGPNAEDGTGAADPWGTSAWLGFQQNIARGGGEVALTYSPGDHTRFGFGISADYIKPDSAFTETDRTDEYKFEDFPEVLKPGLGATTITGFFLRGIRDTRNNLVYPTRGSFARLTLNVNNSLLGGDEIYTRSELDLSKHIHVRKGWVLSSHAAAGITTDGAPYYDRFYIGGAYTIRGFQDWSLSDTDGDDGYWTFTQELRWPLTGRDAVVPRLSGLVFIDVGQGWKRNESFTASDVESAAGYGLRLRLPWLGTMGFDVGIPISDGRKDDPFYAHGSLGFSF